MNDLIQELLDTINEMYIKICTIEEAIKETELTVDYKFCNTDKFQSPTIQVEKVKFSTPKFLHSTLSQAVNKFVNNDDINKCLIPEIFTVLDIKDDSRLVRCELKTIEINNPAVPPVPPIIEQKFNVCEIVTPAIQSVNIIGVNEPESTKTFFTEYLNGLFSIVKNLIESAFILRYAQKDANGFYVLVDGNVVSPNDSTIALNTVRLDVEQDVQDCINNEWFLLLNQIPIFLELITAQAYYNNVFSDFIRPLLCEEQNSNTEQPTCVPVFYGEIREKYKYIPQLHLIHEIVPKPTNPKDLRKTEIVIPFPKLPEDLDTFDPSVFSNAVRTIGDIYAQARWKNFHPTDETTAALFDTEENAKLFFDTYIFPYSLLTPLQSEPDPVTGITTKINTTNVKMREKRITNGRTFRVSRIVYLKFDEQGFGVDCKEWTVPNIPTS